MAYFPLFIDLEGKRVLVIGGGTVASRRAAVLAQFGCEIDVVSPVICDAMEELVNQGTVNWIREEYGGQLGILENRPVFVLAAAVESVNLQVVSDCAACGIPVNDASNKEKCDFYFPGIAKNGDVVAGVTAGGSDHRRAAALTAKIRELLKE